MTSWWRRLLSFRQPKAAAADPPVVAYKRTMITEHDGRLRFSSNVYFTWHDRQGFAACVSGDGQLDIGPHGLDVPNIRHGCGLYGHPEADSDAVLGWLPWDRYPARLTVQLHGDVVAGVRPTQAGAWLASSLTVTHLELLPACTACLSAGMWERAAAVGVAQRYGAGLRRAQPLCADHLFGRREDRRRGKVDRWLRLNELGEELGVDTSWLDEQLAEQVTRHNVGVHPHN